MAELAQESTKKSKATTEHLDEGVDANESRSGAQAAMGGKKIRLTLIEEDNGALTQFQTGLKDRGIKGVELSDIVGEALQTVSKEWWDAKLEELTPFEYKLHAALENPELRAKLMSLLETKKN